MGFEEPNPFASEGEEVASISYQYRHWKLDEDIALVAICEVHSVLDLRGNHNFSL